MPFTFERVKSALGEEQAKLRAQLESFNTADFEDISGGNHMAVDAAVRRTVESALAEAEHALAKFGDGTYGICESCGARIDRARLEILPGAVYCIECQTRRERGTQAGSR